MDILGHVVTVVQVANSFYLLLKEKHHNEKLTKELHSKLCHLYQCISYHELIGCQLPDLIPDLIRQEIISDLQYVENCINKLLEESSKKPIRMRFKWEDIRTDIEGYIETVDNCQQRLETYNLHMDIKNVALKIKNELVRVRDQDIKKLDCQLQQNFVILQKIAHNLLQGDQKIENNVNKLIPSSSTSDKSSSHENGNLDKKEEAQLQLFSSLPEVVFTLRDALVKKGGNDESKAILLDQINTIWDGWKISSKEVSYEFDDDDEYLELGRGATSTVYSGILKVNKSNFIPVAIKKIKLNSKIIPNVLRELFLHLSVQHQCILPVYGMVYPNDGRNGGFAKMIMDRMDYSVEKAFEEGIPFNKKQVLIEISSAVVHLHEHKIIHRDIKPGNILLGKNGGPSKLADFGCSRKQKQTLLSSVSGATGTSFYNPPEVLINPFEYKSSSKWDVWSFGVLICYIFSNNKYTLHENIHSKISSSINPSKDIIVDHVQRWADTIEDEKMKTIAKLCLRKNTSDRPSMRLVYFLLSDTLKLSDIPFNDIRNKNESNEGRTKSYFGYSIVDGNYKSSRNEKSRFLPKHEVATKRIKSAMQRYGEEFKKTILDTSKGLSRIIKATEMDIDIFCNQLKNGSKDALDSSPLIIDEVLRTECFVIAYTHTKQQYSGYYAFSNLQLGRLKNILEKLSFRNGIKEFRIWLDQCLHLRGVDPEGWVKNGILSYALWPVISLGEKIPMEDRTFSSKERMWPFIEETLGLWGMGIIMTHSSRETEFNESGRYSTFESGGNHEGFISYNIRQSLDPFETLKTIMVNIYFGAIEHLDTSWYENKEEFNDMARLNLMTNEDEIFVGSNWWEKVTTKQTEQNSIDLFIKKLTTFSGNFYLDGSSKIFLSDAYGCNWFQKWLQKTQVTFEDNVLNQNQAASLPKLRNKISEQLRNEIINPKVKVVTDSSSETFYLLDLKGKNWNLWFTMMISCEKNGFLESKVEWVKVIYGDVDSLISKSISQKDNQFIHNLLEKQIEVNASEVSFLT